MTRVSQTLKNVNSASFTISKSCDLRYGMTHSSNVTGAPLSSFDLFIFSFVLHENHAMLKVDDELNDACLVHEILTTAAVGAFMVCTDAGNIMWPCIEKAGAKNGWRVQIGGGFLPWKVKMGPKSFVVLERVATHMCEQSVEECVEEA